MDRLQSMRVFQQVVDEGGFAAAARKLDLAPAAVTRLVSDLETHLGVRLLQRTTRRLSLTAPGEEYLARVRAILADIDEAESGAQSHRQELGGTMRILAPPGLAVNVVAPAIARFQQDHPEVTFDVHVEDLAEPPVEDYDLTLLTGTGALHAGIVVRTIIETRAVFCASPDYLKRHGEPKKPEDLAQHRCLRLRTPGVRLRAWTLIDPTRKDLAVDVEVSASIAANHGGALLRATIDGAGISSQPEELIAPLLRAGQLKRVLSPWITGRFNVVAALPSRKFMPARTRAFLDHLVDYAKAAIAQLHAQEVVKRRK